MWLSVRSQTLGYRITYATSPDGINWVRRDDLFGMTVSDEGWDNLAMSCAGIVESASEMLLFYNGNGYGETGFGVARLTL
jgi:hypothetical protein